MTDKSKEVVGWELGEIVDMVGGIQNSPFK